MKKIRIIFLVVTLCGVTGCKVSKPINALLLESQNVCLIDNQTRLEKMFEAYQYGRRIRNISQPIDSIMTAISSGKEQDTIFILESCNPPLYSYYAIVWNKDNAFTLYNSESIVKGLGNEDELKLMRLIEKWDKEEIMSKSHDNSSVKKD